MDVDAWLKELGLEEYAEAFAQHWIDAGLLPRLSDADLNAINVRFGS